MTEREFAFAVAKLVFEGIIYALLGGKSPSEAAKEAMDCAEMKALIAEYEKFHVRK